MCALPCLLQSTHVCLQTRSAGLLTAVCVLSYLLYLFYSTILYISFKSYISLLTRSAGLLTAVCVLPYLLYLFYSTILYKSFKSSISLLTPSACHLLLPHLSNTIYMSSHTSLSLAPFY